MFSDRTEDKSPETIYYKLLWNLLQVRPRPFPCGATTVGRRV